MNLQKIFCPDSGLLAYLTGARFRLYIGGSSSSAQSTSTTTTTTNRQLANNANGTIANTSDNLNNNKGKVSIAEGGGSVFDLSGLVIRNDGKNNTGAGGGGGIIINNSDREVSLAAIDAATKFNTANNAALARTGDTIAEFTRESLAASAKVADSQAAFVEKASGNKAAYYLIGGAIVVGGLVMLVKAYKGK
jgi:hypothetical protein